MQPSQTAPAGLSIGVRQQGASPKLFPDGKRRDDIQGFSGLQRADGFPACRSVIEIDGESIRNLIRSPDLGFAGETFVKPVAG